jgi:hypothetical protein
VFQHQEQEVPRRIAATRYGSAAVLNRLQAPGKVLVLRRALASSRGRILRTGAHEVTLPLRLRTSKC